MNLKPLIVLAMFSLVLVGCAPKPLPTISVDTPVPAAPTLLPEPTLAPTVAPSLPEPAPTAIPPVPPTGDGKALMEDRCSVCHSLDRIQSAHKTAEAWAASVTRMIGHGAVLSADEQLLINQFLADTYK
jgi:hypothetical protein